MNQILLFIGLVIILCLTIKPVGKKLPFPTLLICWYKKGSLFGALAVGMGTVALIRYWMT